MHRPILTPALTATQAATQPHPSPSPSPSASHTPFGLFGNRTWWSGNPFTSRSHLVDEIHIEEL